MRLIFSLFLCLQLALAPQAQAVTDITTHINMSTGTSLGTFDPDEYRNRVEFIAAFAGYLTSGGEGANVSLGGSIGLSAMANNRQLHRDEIEWLEENAARFAEEMGISVEEALDRLSAQAASMVDSLYERDPLADPDALVFLINNRPEGYIPDTKNDPNQYVDANQEWFAATPEQYTNHLINLNTVLESPDIYGNLPPFQAAYGGDGNVFVITQMMTSDQGMGHVGDLSPGETIALTQTIMDARHAIASSPGQYTPSQQFFAEMAVWNLGWNLADQLSSAGALDAYTPHQREQLALILETAAPIDATILMNMADTAGAGAPSLGDIRRAIRVIRGQGVPDANRVVRSADELLTNGRVPSVRNGEFNRWFDDLSPTELDNLWSNPSVREQIEARIRQPRGLHEWCMACRAPEFRRWGVSMDEIQRFRTRTDELT